MLDFIVVGYGTVGRVTEALLAFKKVATYDIDQKSEADIIGGPIPFAKIAYFVCTHEDQVPDVIKSIRETNPEGFIVVRSTVLPGFCDLFYEPNSPVVHMPAFHKETNSIKDFIDRVPVMVIGARHPEDAAKIAPHIKYDFKPLIITDPNTSALAKLINNARLALAVSFWNEIENLTTKFDADIRELANIVCADRRHQKHGTKFFGKAWRGKCLPKDVDNLLKLVNPYSGTLLKAIRESNEKYISHT